MNGFNITFSPTGSTKKVADVLSDKIFSSYKSINLIKNQSFDISFKNDDICIIAVPSFSGRVPEICKERLLHLKGNGAKAILTATFGNRAVDDTLIELYDIASFCKFNVIAGIESVTEHSLVRIYGKGRPDLNDKKELNYFAEKIKEKILKNDMTVPFIPGNRPYREAKSMPMSLELEDSCINCKLCAEECPAGAIDINNVSLLDKNKCFSCLHCVSVCPTSSRHNAKAVTEMLKEKLSQRCKERKENKLYI